MSFNFEKSLPHLLREEPFYAAVSRQIAKRKVREGEGIPYLAVTFNERRRIFEILYNEEAIADWPKKHILGGLKHEIHHIIYRHLTDRKDIDNLKGSSPALRNIAQDLAINSHLQGELPDFVCMPGQKSFEDMPLGLTWYEYYSLIMKKGEGYQQMLKAAAGELLVDVHIDIQGPRDGIADANGNPISGEGRMTREVEAMVRKAMQEARRQGASGPPGTSCMEIMRHIETYFSRQVNWRQVLRSFVQRSIVVNRRKTPHRVNPRYPLIHPGRKVDRVAHLAVAIDQSGSVSDNLLSLVFAELNNLTRWATITVIPFDTCVIDDNVFVWKKGQKRPAERVQSGGTDFNAPTAWVNENKGFDALCIATDLEALAPIPCRVPRIWLAPETAAESGWAYQPAQEKVLYVREEQR